MDLVKTLVQMIIIKSQKVNLPAQNVFYAPTYVKLVLGVTNVLNVKQNIVFLLC